MTSPVSLTVLPAPKSLLRVAGDPTEWGLRDAAVPAPPWLSTSNPVALAVATPLSGTLLLAPGRAGSFTLSPVGQSSPSIFSWIPCPVPYLYLPATTGPTAQQCGYALAPGTDMGTLQRQILTAMADSSQLPVDITVGDASAMVVLNGANLPFVVLTEPQANSPTG